MAARATVDELIEAILAVLADEYAGLGTATVYQLLADVTAGRSARIADPAAHDFVSEIAGLIGARFSDLSPNEIMLGLGRVAQEVDRQRRSGTRPSGHQVAVPSAQQSGRYAIAAGSMRPDGHTGSSRAAAATSAPHTVAPPQARYVREAEYGYVLTWHPARALVSLQFESDSDLGRFATEATSVGHFTVQLEPAPPRLAAVAIDIGLIGREPVGRVAGSAVHIAPPNVIVGLSGAGAMQALAERHRGELRASHHRVDTSSVLSVAAQVEDAHAPLEEQIHEFGVVEPSATEAPRPEAPPTPGARAQTTGTHNTHGLAEEPALRPRAEQSGGNDLGHEPDDTVARRRAAARARAHTLTGSSARVDDDELLRFGRETGRRAPTGQTTALPSAQAGVAHSAGGRHAAGTPTPAPPVVVTEAMRDGERTTTSRPAPAIDSATATGSARVVAAHRVSTADVPAIGPRPVSGSATTTGAAHLVPSRPGQPTPAAGARRAAPTPLLAASTAAYVEHRSVEFPTDGLRLGTLTARRSAAAPSGGAAAVILQACAGYPASLVDIATVDRNWRLALREDALLDIRVEPDSGQFSLRHLIETSGLVDGATLTRMEELAVSTNTRLPDVLVQQQVIRYRQLDAVLSARATVMVSSLLDEPTVSFEIRAYDAIDAHASVNTSISAPAWAKLLALCEDRSQEELEAAIEQRLGDRPAFISNAFIGPPALRLDSRQRRFVEQVLIGEVSVTQGLAQSPLRRRPSLALLVALDLAGLVHWERMETAASRIGRVWPAVFAKYREMATANPFEFLESHWSADGVLVGEAFVAELRTLDLEYILRHGTEEQTRIAQDVHRALVHARDLLQDPRARIAHRAALVGDFNRRAAVQLYEKQAELAIFKSDATGATDALRRVVELDPRHPTASGQLAALLGR